MPTLNKYSPSNEKNGYFIRANVGGNHPITLQVSPVAEAVLRDNGFRHEDNVPTKVVWSMYDVGLLWTENSGNVDRDKSEDINAVFAANNMRAKLRETTRSKLVNYLKGYDGPQRHKLQMLCDSLDRVRPRPSSEAQSHSRPGTIDEAISFLYTQSESVEDFREVKNKAKKYPNRTLSSVQTFYNHPCLAGTCVVRQGGIVEYPVNQDGEKMTIFDVRRAAPTQKLTDESLDEIDYISQYVDTGGGTHRMFFRGDRLVPELEENQDPRNPDGGDVIPKPPIPPVLVLNAIRCEEMDSNPKIQMLPGKPTPDPKTDLVHWVEVDRISNSENPVIETKNGEYILDEGSPGERYAALETNGTWIALAETQERAK